MSEQKDKTEERKEAKPKKVFTISTIVFDDGVLSGTCVEYRDLGRLKNQKCIVPDGDDFITCVRSIVPSAVFPIQVLVDTIFEDLEYTDTADCEKIGKVVVDIYNDGFIDCDFGEIVKGSRGAPKTWRLNSKDFFDAIDCRVGKLSSCFQSLLKSNSPVLTEEETSEMLDQVMEDEGEEEVVYD